MTPPVSEVLELFDVRGMSGPTRQALALAKALENDGWRTTFVAIEESGATNSFLNLASASGIPVQPLHATGTIALLTEIGRLANSYPDALICSHSYRFDILLACLRLLGRLKNPWICMHHGVTTENRLVRLYHWLDLQASRFADEIIVVTQAQVSRFARINRSPVFVPNAILSSPVSGMWIQECERVDTLRLLFMGRLSSEKAPDLAIEILHRVRSEGHTATLTVAGDGPERNALIALARARGVERWVTFLGHVAEPWPLYTSHDVLLLPSRSEGMPNALLEALDAGIPVVATDVGEIREILGPHPALGRVVPSGSVLAIGVSTLLEHAWTRFSSGERARQRRSLLERYSSGTRAQLVSTIYRHFRESH